MGFVSPLCDNSNLRSSSALFTPVFNAPLIRLSINVISVFKKYNQKNYLSNIIELDAYSFSYLYMSKILKIDYELNIIIKDMVIDYIEKNKNDFKELL